jgi:hypothetical protein
MEPDPELQVERGPRRATRRILVVVAAALSAGTLAAGASALAQPATQPHVVRGEAVWQGVPPCAEQRLSTLPRD